MSNSSNITLNLGNEPAGINRKGLKIGFLPASRGFFDQTLAARMREEILNAAAEIGVELICPTPQQTRMGCVESLAESILCAELFAANRVDGILVSAVNFGDEQAVAQAIRRSGLSVPILLHACPEDGPLRIGGKRRDSFCGLLSIADALRQIGATYSIAADVLAKPNSDSFRRELAEFAAVCRVVRGVRSARYGQAGARPDAFWTCRFDERALQRLGPTTVTLDLSEVMARVNALPDALALETLSGMRSSTDTQRTPEASLIRMAKFEHVLRAWIASENLDALSIQCWTSIEQNLGICPCFVMSRLGDLGVPCACEADGLGALSMHALQLAGGAAPALADWNNLHHADPDLVNLWHCGVFPASMAESRPELDTHSILAASGAVEESKTHGVLNLRVRPGDATLFRAAQSSDGSWNALVVGGCFESDESRTLGSQGWCRIPGLLDFYKNTLLRHYPHHVAFSFGCTSRVLREAFGSYLGFRIHEAGFNQSPTQT
jgi:L-fucose isomerase-like protein